MKIDNLKKDCERKAREILAKAQVQFHQDFPAAALPDSLRTDIEEALLSESLIVQKRVETLEKELAGMYAAVCEDCGGTGSLGRAKDGRLVSCESCGGHEDSLGTGFKGEILKIKEQQKQIDELTKELDWYGSLIHREKIGTKEVPNLRVYIEQLEAKLEAGKKAAEALLFWEGMEEDTDAALDLCREAGLLNKKKTNHE